jgi:hypothetical protein
MIILKYEIPRQYKVSTNQIYSWIHWRKRKQIADWYHQLTKKDCKEFSTLLDKVDISFKFYFRSRYLDSSNCSFMWKMIEDSLVKNKLIKDDSNMYIWCISYESMIISQKDRKKLNNDFVRIIIS